MVVLPPPLLLPWCSLGLQPSYRILEQIDRILLLHKGSVAFCGALPRLEASLDSIGLPVPMRMNALEYAIELLQGTPDSTMVSA